MKNQVLLILPINSDCARYRDELRRCAALGSLTVTQEGEAPS